MYKRLLIKTFTGCLAVFMTIQKTAAQDSLIYYSSSKDYWTTNGYTGASSYFPAIDTLTAFNIGILLPVHISLQPENLPDDSVRTDLFFKTGNNNYQHFVSKHQQYLARHLKMANIINTFYSEGFFTNSKNAYFNTAGFFNYDYSHWKIHLNYQYLRAGFQEYGGLSNDSVNFLISERKYAQTYFSSALNRYKMFYLQPSLQYKVSKFLKLIYQSNFSKITSAYSDDNTDSLSYSYYGINNIENQSAFYDSLSYFTTGHFTGISYSSQYFNIHGGIRLSTHQAFWQKKTYFNQWEALAKLQYKSFQLQGNYIFSGYNASNYSANLQWSNLATADTSKWQLKFNARLIQTKPSYMAYIKNNLTQNEIIKFLNYSIIYLPFKTKLTLNYTDINNYTYLSENGNFNQSDAALFQTQVSQQFRYKFFANETQIIFNQEFKNNLFRVPQWMFSSHFYITYGLFHRKILLTTGIQLNTFTSSYLKQWHPVYRNYRIQNTYKSGNYPIIDLHFSAQIKNFKTFINVLHINDGLSGNNYYFLPQYPIYGRWLQLGIQWIFLD